MAQRLLRGGGGLWRTNRGITARARSRQHLPLRDINQLLGFLLLLLPILAQNCPSRRLTGAPQRHRSGPRAHPRPEPLGVEGTGCHPQLTGRHPMVVPPDDGAAQAVLPHGAAGLVPPREQLRQGMRLRGQFDAATTLTRLVVRGKLQPSAVALQSARVPLVISRELGQRLRPREVRPLVFHARLVLRRDVFVVEALVPVGPQLLAMLPAPLRKQLPWSVGQTPDAAAGSGD
mmetsp:Transcript_27246/g.78376  ORF Transcript_27246/g.78376 Transcript_27246/m.78376 type:complete len:232 (+) Transcript_27246:13-708(+)